MHPVLFTLPGGFPVYSYGVMLGLSCVLGAHLAVALSERSGIERGRAGWMALIVILCGLMGGRIHELIVTGRPLSEALQPVHSGRTAYGGFLAGILSALVAARLLGVSFWRFGDAAAPTMALGLGLTRIGCFLFGCDYGLVSERWGVRFPPGSPAWRDQVEAGVLAETAPASLPVLPTQLLSSAAGLLLFGALMAVWFRRPRREGAVLLSFLGGYGLVRAGLEQLRSDAGRGELLGLSTSTTIGLFTAAAAVAALLPPLARWRGDAGPILTPPPPEPAA